jgi:hypothetical protein
VRFVDSGGWRGPTRLTRRGKHSGSGSARLDPSQKGDLPSSGEWAVFIWSKVADARNPNGKRPRLSRVPYVGDSQKGPEEVLHRRGLSVLPGRFWMGREGSPSTKGSQNHLVPPQAERPRCRRNPGPPAPGG